MASQPACYGDIFPRLDDLELNRPLTGRAFRVVAESAGIGVTERRISVDREGWDKCVACDRYRDCYDLSIAKLLLWQALNTRV